MKRLGILLCALLLALGGTASAGLLLDDATPDFLESSSLMVTLPFTWGAYASSDGTAADGGVVCVADTGSANTDRRFLFMGGTGGSTLRQNTRRSTGVNAVTTTNWETDTWHIVIGAEASATSRSVWLDGGGKGTNSTSRVPVSLDNTTIGAIRDTAVRAPLSGSVANVFAYSRLLADGEAEGIGAGGHPYSVATTALAHWMPLLGDSSPEIDVVGGLAFVLNGTPTKIGVRPIGPQVMQGQQQ